MEENKEAISTIDEEEKVSSKFAKGIVLGTFIGIILSGLVFLGIHLFLTSSSDDSAIIDDVTINKIKNVQKIINKNLYLYNDEITVDNMKDGIFRGMLGSLGDKYAEYYSKEELIDEINDDKGISFGIGCQVSFNDDGMPQVIGLLDESPAEAAGVLPGDIIFRVNGESTAGLTLTQVVGLIKGPENTEVEITFLRGEEYVEMTIIRGKVIENTTVVYGTLVDNPEVAYIRINEFDKVTLGQYEDAMKEMQDQKVKGVILDLRNNTGGDLATCVDIARDILPEGMIVYTENKAGEKKEYTCDGKKELKLPLVVLVNEYTASASEILAGAIQDHNKGTILGTKTFGKGIVQRIFDLSDGSALKITISAYFTPNGRNIHGTGIIPDIELEYDVDAAKEDGSDNQITRALEVLEQQMK
ncbi:MAG: S41 family peptidase [Lachnospiraceae bacterium]|nr:S41 family peptidase [Lachnospiraceae bacterium]